MKDVININIQFSFYNEYLHETDLEEIERKEELVKKTIKI
jgi:hypothetical protein